MKTDDLWGTYDITDYHRLLFLGENVEEILTIILKNMAAGVGVFEVGETVRALFLNEAFFQCIGLTKEEYLTSAKDILKTIVEEDVEGFKNCILDNAPQNNEIIYTFRGYRSNGVIGWFHIQGVPIENMISPYPIYLAVITDITDRKEKEDKIEALKEANAKLLLQEERYKILEATAQGLLFEFYPDEDKMVFSYNFPDNKKRKEITNYSEYIKESPLVHSSHIEAFKQALYGACKEETEGNLEYLSAVSGGGYRWHTTHYKSLAGADGEIYSVIGRIEDIHDSKMEKLKLNYKADMDGLTNLYRKEAAFEKMQEYVDESPDGKFYFIILDLDDFKQINDQYGHQYGDEVLKKMAKELVNCFAETSILGRFGGDEFVILTRNMPYEEVEKSLNRLKEHTCFCAGIVAWQHGEDIKSVFDKADKAMYHVKLSNKNGIYFQE